METREKILKIEASPWCDEAARLLAATLRGVPCFTVEDYRLELERNPDCKLYRVSEEGGALVGFVVLRLERYHGGAEGVLLAAAGRMAGSMLYGQVLPALERMFEGVFSLRADPCRAGAIRELLKAGYLPTHVTMRKPAGAPARPVMAQGDDLLAELDQAGARELGGPSIQARPGKLHKGGSSSSTTQSVQNIDRRQVVDAGGVGFASDGGTYTVNVLDNGAIARALALVEASDQNQAQLAGELLGFTKDIFTSGLTVLDKAGKQVETQTELVSKAYDAARGEGTQKNLIAAAALATVAVVAVKVWGK